MTDSVCSDLGHEPLPGTAKAGTLFIALEHQYGWSHDILDGGVFGDELTARIKEWLAERGGSLLPAPAAGSALRPELVGSFSGSALGRQRAR